MRWFALILILIMPSWSWSEQLQVNSQYLCIAEKATGFVYRDDEFKSRNFKTDKLKWIVKSYGEVTRGQDGLVDDLTGEIYQFDADDVPDFVCEAFMNSIFKCTQGSLGEFKMNTVTKKYIRTCTADFDLFFETATPFLEIGNCSKF